jgi:hypothetical protein
MAIQKEMIEQSRKQQMDKRTNEKNRKQQEEKEFAQYWKVRNDELSLAE